MNALVDSGTADLWRPVQVQASFNDRLKPECNEFVNSWTRCHNFQNNFASRIDPELQTLTFECGFVREEILRTRWW